MGYTRIASKRPSVRQLVDRPPLSPRERQVVELIADGYTSQQIADKLGITYKTAEKHRQNAMAKLGIANVAGIVRWVLRQNEAEPE